MRAGFTDRISFLLSVADFVEISLWPKTHVMVALICHRWNFLRFQQIEILEDTIGCLLTVRIRDDHGICRVVPAPYPLRQSG